MGATAVQLFHSARYSTWLVLQKWLDLYIRQYISSTARRISRSAVVVTILTPPAPWCPSLPTAATFLALFVNYLYQGLLSGGSDPDPGPPHGPQPRPNPMPGSSPAGPPNIPGPQPANLGPSTPVSSRMMSLLVKLAHANLVAFGKWTTMLRLPKKAVVSGVNEVYMSRYLCPTKQI